MFAFQLFSCRLWTNFKTWCVFNLHYDDGKWQMESEVPPTSRGLSDGVIFVLTCFFTN